MASIITQEQIMQAMDWAYQKAVDGIPGTGSAEELAAEYLRDNNNHPLDATNSLIRWQNSKAATAGFVTGLGGLITLPVAIPANIASVMYLQMRMIAAIAAINGKNIRDDKVKTMIYICLAGNAVKDVLKDVGISVANKVALNAIKSISGETIKRINQAVGLRLLTKAGSTGVLNLTKMVPILGGVIGGTFDAVTTNSIGNVARDAFVDETQVAAS